ncbi:hypothetical protein LBW89_21135 [Paenibacillus sp. alder61]|uniref:hypothetical protein n=1 Tax=Paenibacillus sp. alder61 TaxID=2862948 RepID=UPI001CD40C36|nr:hypothetical protein [Paenibacillus sp. alder61]MCA1295516.1 hypothetical protein [Paenibacillus sp. alder61]
MLSDTNLFAPYMALTLSLGHLRTKDEVRNVFLALKSGMDEDPRLLVFTKDETKQIILAGAGKQHLADTVRRLTDRFDVELKAEAPQVLYKETFARPFEAEGRFNRQSSSPARYGHCWLRFEPLPRGGGFEFVNQIQDEEMIPLQFVPFVKKGLERSMTRGYAGGFPVVDFRATLFKGSYHATDSSAMCYMVAATIGFKQAIQQSDLIILEPFMQVAFEGTSSDQLPLLIEAIRSSRGRSESLQPNGGGWRGSVDIPLKELDNFSNDLTCIFKEVQKLEVQFAYYDQVPDHLMESIISNSIFIDAYCDNLDYLDQTIDSFWGQ